MDDQKKVLAKDKCTRFAIRVGGMAAVVLLPCDRQLGVASVRLDEYAGTQRYTVTEKRGFALRIHSSGDLHTWSLAVAGKARI